MTEDRGCGGGGVLDGGDGGREDGLNDVFRSVLSFVPLLAASGS